MTNLFLQRVTTITLGRFVGHMRKVTIRSIPNLLHYCVILYYVGMYIIHKCCCGLHDMNWQTTGLMPLVFNEVDMA